MTALPDVVDPAPMATRKTPADGSPPRVPGDPATARLEMRVTATEKAVILAGAKAAKKTASDYLRDLALADAARATGAEVPKQAPRSAKNRATKPRS